MTDDEYREMQEALYEDYKSSPHAGNGNSEHDRLVNHERQRMRQSSGEYGPDYERRKAEYLRQKAEDARHAGN